MKNKRIWSLILVFVFMLQSICISTVSANDATYTKNNSDTTVSSSALTADNGTIELMADENNATALNDIVLVLDSSGSMDGDRMPTLKEASIKFSESVLKSNPNSRIAISAFGVYGYSDYVKTFDFSNDLEELTNNINSLYYDGGTPIHSGINYADKLFMDSWNENSVKSMIIMSDGEPDSESSALEAYNSVADKYNIYSVYLGTSDTAKSFMEKIQNKGFFASGNVGDLIEDFGKIADKILHPFEIYTAESLESENGVNNYIYEIVIYLHNTNLEPIYNVEVRLIPTEKMHIVNGDTESKKLDIVQSSQNSDAIAWKVEIPFSEVMGVTTIPYTIQVQADNCPSNFYDDSITITPFNTSNHILSDKDVWKFNNYTISSSNGILYDDFKETLFFGLNNSYKELLTDKMNKNQNGQCYGMSVTVILEKMGIFDSMSVPNESILNVLKKVKDASSLSDLKKDKDIQCFINYYHLIQFLPAALVIKEYTSSKADFYTLYDLEEKANACALTGGAPVLIDFNLNKGGHAMVGYDIEYGSWKKKGKNYGARVVTYDPNFQIFKSDSYVYFNPGSGEWCIPNYYDDGAYSEKNKFKAIVNDVNLIDGFNLENKTVNLVRNLSIIETNKEGRLWVNGGEIIKNGELSGDVDYFYDVCDDSENQYVNIFLDEEKDYLFENDNEANMNISLMYHNYYSKASSQSTKGSSFSPEGKVSLIDNNGEYMLGLTANDGYSSLPWYTVKVDGTSAAKNPSLEVTENGYLFEGEELSNIKVTANNDDETKELTFDSDKTSVLITNDGDDLVVKEDTDGDGNYETPIADSDGKVTPGHKTEDTTKQKGGSGSGSGKSSKKASGIVETTTEATTESSEEKISSDKKIMVTIGEKAVVVGDKTYSIDVAPYIQTSSNSTLVPLRFVALAVGGENADTSSADGSKNISWDAVNKTATIIVNNHTIQFKADSNIMIVDGASKVMDNGVKAEITDGRMFIPFRALGEALGVSVDWDANSKTAVYTVK